jgi:hypothetical protein
VNEVDEIEKDMNDEEKKMEQHVVTSTTSEETSRGLQRHLVENCC